MTQGSNIIRRVASTNWSYDVKTLRKTYITLGRSIIEYASAVWSPWISLTNMEKLEAAQRDVARSITGLVKTTPNDVNMRG